MLYLNKLKTKTLLILLCGLITLHVAFVSTKTYTVKIIDDQKRYGRNGHYNIEIINASEMQYQICLSSFHGDYQAELISNTEIKYFKNLPEKSILYIYLGYFLIATGFILTAKFTINESTNEN